MTKYRFVSIRLDPLTGNLMYRCYSAEGTSYKIRGGNRIGSCRTNTKKRLRHEFSLVNGRWYEFTKVGCGMKQIKPRRAANLISKYRSNYDELSRHIQYQRALKKKSKNASL